jgi:hypothetical protein
MYLSILYFGTINKLKLFFECCIPMPQDAGTPLLSQLQIFKLYQISIAVLENVPHAEAGLQKKTTLSTLSVGTGDRGSNPGHLRGRQRRKTLSHPLRFSHVPSQIANY